MIQFSKAVFSENSLCMLEFSILIKMLHNIFGHNTDYVVFCFAACLPATVLHDVLRDKFLFSFSGFSVGFCINEETSTSF